MWLAAGIFALTIPQYGVPFAVIKGRPRVFSLGLKNETPYRGELYPIKMVSSPDLGPLIMGGQTSFNQCLLAAGVVRDYLAPLTTSWLHPLYVALLVFA